MPMTRCKCGAPIRNVPDCLLNACDWLCADCASGETVDRGYQPHTTCGGQPMRADRMRPSVDLPPLKLGAAGIAEAKKKMEEER